MENDLVLENLVAHIEIKSIANSTYELFHIPTTLEDFDSQKLMVINLDQNIIFEFSKI